MHAAPNSLAVVCLDRLTTRRRKRVWSFPLASSPTPALPDWYWAEAQDGSLDVLGCPVTMSKLSPSSPPMALSRVATHARIQTCFGPYAGVAATSALSQSSK